MEHDRPNEQPDRLRASRLFSRLFGPVSLLFGLCVLTFFLSYVAPGDPARIILGPNAHEDAVQTLRKQMGFDRPLIVQFGDFLVNTATGKWGTSWITGQPVLREIAAHLGPTVSLGLVASVYSMVCALMLNAAVFLYPRLGQFVIPLLRLGISFPSFVVAIAAALATTRLQSWMAGPVATSGDSVFTYAIPGVAVALYPACVMTALLRDRFGNVLTSPFFKAGRAAGFSNSHLFVRVLLRNSWSILLTAWVNQISLLVYSTIIVEYVWSFRGLGTLLVRSIEGKDLPVLSGIILLNGLFFLAVQTLSDQSFRISRDVAKEPELKQAQTAGLQ